MNPATESTPTIIAARLRFSAELLTELATGIEANALALPASDDARKLGISAEHLRQIAGEHQRIAGRIKGKQEKGQEKAAKSSQRKQGGRRKPCLTA